MHHRHSYSLKIVFVFLIVFFALGVGFFSYFDSLKKEYTAYAVFPNGEKIKIVDILRTDEARAKGLSGRESLAQNEGMYFIFPNEDTYGFWMKDMFFPIDIFWISNGEIVDISENAFPQPGVLDSELVIYTPHMPIGAVLEMAHGAKSRYNLKVGDKIQIRFIPKNSNKI